MTRDLDSLLRGADPLGDASADDALLPRLRARVDAERAGALPLRRRPRWVRRAALVAAAAAVVTAVPLVVSTLDDGRDGPPALLAPAVAATIGADGTISCVGSYTASVPVEDARVRLLPDRLPEGWSYDELFARQDDPAACGPVSLAALRTDATGLVTGRVSVTGPIAAEVDRRGFRNAAEDTLFGRSAQRFDATAEATEYHHWVFSDAQGQWAAEASGMPLDEARRTLASVAIDGPQVTWDAATAEPGWTLVHLRTGPPYGTVPGRFTWYVELMDGAQRRSLDVTVADPPVPLVAGAGIGEQVTTLDGHPAVLLPVRTAGPVAPGTETDVPGGTSTQHVLVEVAPGTVAHSMAFDDDLADVEAMLTSLRQVPADDPRIEEHAVE